MACASCGGPSRRAPPPRASAFAVRSAASAASAQPCACEKRDAATHITKSGWSSASSAGVSVPRRTLRAAAAAKARRALRRGRRRRRRPPRRPQTATAAHRARAQHRWPRRPPPPPPPRRPRRPPWPPRPPLLRHRACASWPPAPAGESAETVRYCGTRRHGVALSRSSLNGAFAAGGCLEAASAPSASALPLAAGAVPWGASAGPYSAAAARRACPHAEV